MWYTEILSLSICPLSYKSICTSCSFTTIVFCKVFSRSTNTLGTDANCGTLLSDDFSIDLGVSICSCFFGKFFLGTCAISKSSAPGLVCDLDVEGVSFEVIFLSFVILVFGDDFLMSTSGFFFNKNASFSKSVVGTFSRYTVPDPQSLFFLLTLVKVPVRVSFPELFLL